MGLRWEQRQPTKRWFGYDVEGNVYALVERRGRGWQLHLTQPACGVPGGTWLPDPWPTADEAMEAGDRYAVAYVDAPIRMDADRPRPPGRAR